MGRNHAPPVRNLSFIRQWKKTNTNEDTDTNTNKSTDQNTDTNTDRNADTKTDTNTDTICIIQIPPSHLYCVGVYWGNNDTPVQTTSTCDWFDIIFCLTGSLSCCTWGPNKFVFTLYVKRTGRFLEFWDDPNDQYNCIVMQGACCPSNIIANHPFINKGIKTSMGK